jgi:hypothetical protein
VTLCCGPGRFRKIVVNELSVYVWHAPLQSRSSLTVYWILGFALFWCAPGSKLPA